MNPRACAAGILSEVLRRRVSLTQALAQGLSPSLSPQERGITQELCYGVMRWWPRLELQLQALLRKPFKQKDTDIYALLLIGLYQLQFMRVPSHAAVSETVNAVATLNKTWARSLVNAVLRNFLRKDSGRELHKVSHAEPREKQDAFSTRFAQDEVYQTAHPRWLLSTIRAAWPRQWQSIMQANNERPPMTLRVNVVQCNAQTYLQQLHANSIDAQLQRHSASAITLQQPCDVQHLPGFAEGRVSVQDQAAQLAASLLDLQPGQRVLDVCAAPGGKTAHLLESQPDLAQLVAVDIDEGRLQRVSENLSRLQLHATIVCGDASHPESWWDGQMFDRILLDAPCSATGVIRRHPDIKWLRQAKDVDNLVVQQREILDAVWPLLKPGGKLLYATCSILPQENSQQVQNFLQRHHQNGNGQVSYEQSNPQSHVAREQVLQVEWGLAQEAGRQILPGDDNMDGFYYALLEKVRY